MTLSVSQKASLNEATDRYASTVEAAASFLAARGIDRETAHSYRLGVVSEPVAGHERFQSWLSIPYFTQHGTVAIKFRCIREHDCEAEHCQRYDAPAGQKVRLFNARVCDEGGDIGAVVEGEFKAIAVTELLGIPAVSTSAGIWLDHWPRCMSNFDRVVVICDNDVKDDGSNPGMKHAQKVRKSIEGADLLVPPPGLKIDDWVNRDGAAVVLRELGL
jgi:hypothetical protein